MPDNKRQKASDVFRETDFFLAKKSGFDQAFPQIATLSGTVEEDGDGVSDRLDQPFLFLWHLVSTFPNTY